MVAAQPNKTIQEKLVGNLMELPNRAVSFIIIIDNIIILNHFYIKYLY